MNSLGFEIKINDKRLCRAGFDVGQSVLVCALDLARKVGQSSDRMEINVVGMEREFLKPIVWVLQQALQKGDQITIEVVSGNFDLPLHPYTYPNIPTIDFENHSIKDILDIGRELFDN
ncbi:MAG: hypothetical protein SF052_15970 [Bacteroidia bacterium]|nr:hypothetical protein [Bacteroidia bacterium]